MMRIIYQAWKRFRLYVLVSVALVLLLFIEADSGQYHRTAERKTPTASDITFSCSPTVVHQLGSLQISKASNWVLGHAYHCLGHENVIMTVSVNGYDRADRLISEAIALTYIQFLKNKKGLNCDDDLIIIEPLEVSVKSGRALVVPYILQCDKSK